MEKLKEALEELTNILDREEFKWWQAENNWKDPNHTGALDYVQGKTDGLRFAQNALIDLKKKYGLMGEKEK